MSDNIPMPLMADYPPGQLHVVPKNDAKDHVVSLTEPCWCKPQAQEESKEHSTLIHKPISPVIEGHKLDIRKILIGKKDDIEFVAEIPRR